MDFSLNKGYLGSIDIFEVFKALFEMGKKNFKIPKVPSNFVWLVRLEARKHDKIYPDSTGNCDNSECCLAPKR